MQDQIKIQDGNGSVVNFQIVKNCKLITLSDGFSKQSDKDGFRVALPPDAIEGGIISAKLLHGPDVFIDIPIYLGGWNDVILKEINTTDHSIGLTTIYIGK